MEHLTRVVFNSIRSTSLRVKAKKCQLGMDWCSYLGHIVGSGEVRPESEKLKVVESFPTPKPKKELVRIFLGLTGYYRKFIPSYSTIAAPLTDLTKKKAPNSVIWTEECESAFMKLKQLLCSEPVLQVLTSLNCLFFKLMHPIMELVLSSANEIVMELITQLDISVRSLLHCRERMPHHKPWN